MNTQINYASLAGAYKGTMHGLIYDLPLSKIVDVDKYDELRAFITKKIEHIESTYSKASISTGG